MWLALLFASILLSSHCIFESHSYNIILGSEAQNAPKDAIPKVKRTRPEHKIFIINVLRSLYIIHVISFLRNSDVR